MKDDDNPPLLWRGGRLGGRARVKAELDIKVLQDQVRTLKKHNQTLASKSKDEALMKVKALEEVERKCST